MCVCFMTVTIVNQLWVDAHRAVKVKAGAERRKNSVAARLHLPRRRPRPPGAG